MKNASENTMRDSEDDLQYEDLDDSQPRYEAYVCNRCGNPAYVAASRRRIVLWLLIVLLLIAVWVGFISLYMGQNVLESSQTKHKLLKNIADQFPIVPTEFWPDRRYMDSDPFDSHFWMPTVVGDQEPDYMKKNQSDNPWNSYGNNYMLVAKDSPYVIPYGLPLEPLYPERDYWLKDYTAFITAFGHEIHCVGVIKHVLDALHRGEKVEGPGVPKLLQVDYEHQKHCMDVIRQAISCNPDFQLSVYWDGTHKGPFWGGQKHMCRDQHMVHQYLAQRNIGMKDDFNDLNEDGSPKLKVWSWPLD